MAQRRSRRRGRNNRGGPGGNHPGGGSHGGQGGHQGNRGGFRGGHHSRPPHHSNGRNGRMDRGPSQGLRIPELDSLPLDGLRPIKPFEELTSIDPQPRLTLEYPGCPASCRLIDLFCPIGRGQRGLIVSPPKAGKTTLLKDIAGAILRNHPEMEVVVLLVDERPEEVTDFRRTFAPRPARAMAAGESALNALLEASSDPAQQVPFNASRVRVVASSNDHDVDTHVQVAIQTVERCKRLVECGKHVVMVLDSLTRLGRAFNNSRRFASSGRTLTGGLDSRALEIPKQLFGSARNTEEAGSLTIIASCLVDTGSAGDQVIFEEFKGTGNMELILDRKVSEQRLFPAINLAASGTRKENLLMGEAELKTMTALRRRLMAMPPPQQVEQLLAAMKRFPTNAALVGSAG